MKKIFPELLVTRSLEDGAPVELNDLTRGSKMEIEDFNVETVENVSAGFCPESSKAGGWATVTPPLFGLLKPWIERKSSPPANIKIRWGKRLLKSNMI